MTQPVPAVVFDAHDYDPLSKTADPHGHGTDCDCSPACKVCGSAADAYIHLDEAAAAGATVVVRTVASADVGAAVEHASSSS